MWRGGWDREDRIRLWYVSEVFCRNSTSYLTTTTKKILKMNKKELNSYTNLRTTKTSFMAENTRRGFEIDSLKALRSCCGLFP